MDAEPRCVYCDSPERIPGCPFRGLRPTACVMGVPGSWQEYRRQQAERRTGYAQRRAERRGNNGE
jgi:hypothetical protein